MSVLAFCAQAIPLNLSSLSNIENGKSYPSMQTVLNVMDKFEVSPEEFFNFEYLVKDTELAEKIIEIIKCLPYERKQLLYKVIKQFEV